MYAVSCGSCTAYTLNGLGDVEHMLPNPDGRLDRMSGSSV